MNSDMQSTSDDRDRDEWRSSLKNRHRFYIMNPAYTRGQEYSLWIRQSDGGETYEYPVMSSNTGGFVTFNSRHTGVGDGIEPTDEFLDALGICLHEALCFMPDMYFRNGDESQFIKTGYSIYDDAPREYELWAVQILVDWMCRSNGDNIPELEPLVEWAASFTEMPVPRMGTDADRRAES